MALAALRKADPVIAALIDANPDFDPEAWLAQLPKMDGFGVLIFQVIGQQLSVAVTRTMLGRLMDRFGGHLPSPEQLLAADPEVVRSAGLSHRKVQTLRELAERFVDGRLDPDELQRLSDEEIVTRLIEVPGVGRWTAEGFLAIALHREDVVLPGDLALRKAIQRVYGLDHLPSQAEVVAIAEPWRPYRSLAVTTSSRPSTARSLEPTHVGWPDSGMARPPIVAWTIAGSRFAARGPTSGRCRRGGRCGPRGRRGRVRRCDTRPGKHRDVPSDIRPVLEPAACQPRGDSPGAAQ
jgi:DNA-3-methyladenine glycosylase II